MELRVSEAARWLEVSAETIRRYLAKGILRGRRLPTGERRINADSVQEILTRQTADADREGNADV